MHRFKKSQKSCFFNRKKECRCCFVDLYFLIFLFFFFLFHFTFIFVILLLYFFIYTLDYYIFISIRNNRVIQDGSLMKLMNILIIFDMTLKKIAFNFFACLFLINFQFIFRITILLSLKRIHKRCDKCTRKQITSNIYLKKKKNNIEKLQYHLLKIHI